MYISKGENTMTKARYLYSELATAIQARINCGKRNYNQITGKCSVIENPDGNTEWFQKWTDRIDMLVDMLPSGSGIDNGTEIDLDASHAEKLVFTFGFHHMDENGFYDSWTDHKLVVTPSFTGINLRISGRDRNQIKEYLYDTYEYALTREVEPIK
jgi:hypothetical protein